MNPETTVVNEAGARIDTTLYVGRPEDESDRLDKEIRVYDLLEKLEVPFVRLDHDVMPTMEACKGVDALLGMDICKNLFLCNAQKTKFYLLLMPGDRPFKTKFLSKQIGSSRLSFAGPEFMEELLDVTPGSVTVLGLMNDHEHRVQLLIDSNVVDGEEFGCHPCINTSSIKFKTADLLKKILPAIGHEPIYVDLSCVEEG